MSFERMEDTVDGYTDTFDLVPKHHQEPPVMFENSEQYSVVDEYQGLPEPEHVETVVNGIMDTFAGNEGLTYAQHYLHSCLHTSGGISGRTGVEGFFSTVGNGLKAAWEYLMKMFKSIWNFFFGGGEEGEEKGAKKAKDQVDKDTASIKEVSEPTKIPEVVKKVVQKAKKQAQEAKTTGDEHKSNAVAELLQKNFESGKKLTKEDLTHAVHELILADSEGKKRLDAAILKFGEVGDKFRSAFQTKDDSKIHGSSAEDLKQKILAEVKPAAINVNEVVKKIKVDITQVHQAVELQKALDDCLKAKGALSSIIRRHKSDIQKEINHLQTEINKAGNETNSQLQKDLEGCKELLTMVARSAKLSESMHDAVKAVSKANAHLVAA